jgi:hypothetical protein
MNYIVFGVKFYLFTSTFNTVNPYPLVDSSLSHGKIEEKTVEIILIITYYTFWASAPVYRRNSFFKRRSCYIDAALICMQVIGIYSLPHYITRDIYSFYSQGLDKKFRDYTAASVATGWPFFIEIFRFKDSDIQLLINKLGQRC